MSSPEALEIVVVVCQQDCVLYSYRLINPNLDASLSQLLGKTETDADSLEFLTSQCTTSTGRLSDVSPRSLGFSNDRSSLGASFIVVTSTRSVDWREKEAEGLALGWNVEASVENAQRASSALKRVSDITSVCNGLLTIVPHSVPRETSEHYLKFQAELKLVSDFAKAHPKSILSDDYIAGIIQKASTTTVDLPGEPSKPFVDYMGTPKEIQESLQSARLYEQHYFSLKEVGWYFDWSDYKDVLARVETLKTSIDQETTCNTGNPDENFRRCLSLLNDWSTHIPSLFARAIKHFRISELNGPIWSRVPLEVQTGIELASRANYYLNQCLNAEKTAASYSKALRDISHAVKAGLDFYNNSTSDGLLPHGLILSFNRHLLQLAPSDTKALLEQNERIKNYSDQVLARWYGQYVQLQELKAALADQSSPVHSISDNPRFQALRDKLDKESEALNKALAELSALKSATSASSFAAVSRATPASNDPATPLFASHAPKTDLLASGRTIAIKSLEMDNAELRAELELWKAKHQSVLVRMVSAECTAQNLKSTVEVMSSQRIATTETVQKEMRAVVEENAFLRSRVADHETTVATIRRQKDEEMVQLKTSMEAEILKLRQLALDAQQHLKRAPSAAPSSDMDISRLKSERDEALARAKKAEENFQKSEVTLKETIHSAKTTINQWDASYHQLLDAKNRADQRIDHERRQVELLQETLSRTRTEAHDQIEGLRAEIYKLAAMRQSASPDRQRNT